MVDAIFQTLMYYQKLNDIDIIKNITTFIKIKN